MTGSPMEPFLLLRSRRGHRRAVSIFATQNLGYQKGQRRWLAFVLENHDGSEERVEE